MHNIISILSYAEYNMCVSVTTRDHCSLIGIIPKRNLQTSMPPRKLSGLQRDVLSLYRMLLRSACRKDRPEGSVTATSTSTPTRSPSPLPLPPPSPSPGLADLMADSSTSTAHARSEFRREAADVARRDFRKIEYLIRKGKKHVKLLDMPGVQSTFSTVGGRGSREG